MLRGEIEAFETRDGTEYNLATAHERDFMGDVSMLQGTSILGSSTRHIGRGRDTPHSRGGTPARTGGNSRA